MRKYWLVIGGLVVVAAGAASYSILGKDEQALIAFKDKRYDEAFKIYQAKFEAGDTSPETIGALVDLHLQYGSIDKAIAVMESYVAKNPASVAARENLGVLYQYAQRPDDYLKNLEAIKELRPDDKTIEKRLADAYKHDANYEKQLPVLQSLVDKDSKGESTQFRSLANLQATGKKWKDAILTMQKFRTDRPSEFVFNDLEFYVSLLMEDKQYDVAQAEVQNWQQQQGEQIKLPELARFVNILNYKGSPQAAYTLLQPYEANIQNTPELLPDYIMVLINMNRAPEAYAIMKQLYADKKLPEGMEREMLFQAIAQNDLPMVIELYDSVDAENFNESQLITLTELSVLKNQPELLSKVKQRFSTPESLNGYPVLSVLLGLYDNAPDTNARIEKAESLNLPLNQRLVVARACARYGNGACITRIMDKLPNTNDLSEAELVNVAELYLLSKDYTRGYAFVNQLRETRQMKGLDALWAKFAAATGDEKALGPWLDNTKEIAEGDLKDLYFLAGTGKAYATQASIAERLYERFPGDDSRNYVVTSYLQSGRNSDAMKILREQKNRSAQDEDNYFYLLMKLSKTDPAIRRELTDYAAAHLKSNISERKRLAMVYTLIQAGRSDIAMPYIKQYAQTLGGQWVDVYTSNLDKQGKTEEARQMRLQLASQPGTSAKVKRQIAYALLNQGYTADATGIFSELAANAPADSEEVQQLLYLWGPRLSEEQLAWIGSRVQASSGTQREWWMNKLLNQSGAEEFVSYVNSDSLILQDERAARKYMQSLLALGYLNEPNPALTDALIASNNPTLLRELGRATRASGQPAVAEQAFMRLAEMSPDDQEALRVLGLASYAQADYSEAGVYLGNYLNQKHTAEYQYIDKEDYQAYFYQAEMLRREKKFEQANAYYQRALDIVIASPNRNMDMESKAVQSMVRLGNLDGGLATFRELVSRHPEDRLVRADFASTLIESKRYAEARDVLKADQGSTPAATNYDAPSTAIQVPANELEGYRFFSNGSEVLLKFKSKKARDAFVNPQNIKRHDWVAYSTEGYDRVLIGATYPNQLALVPASNGYLITKRNDIRTDAKLQKDLDLRYQLLNARVDLETGKAGAAIARLDAIAPEYDNDIQRLGFTANAQNYAGRWKRAMGLLDRAAAINPKNEDIASLRRDIWLLHAQHVKLDYEYLAIGENTMNHTTLSGRADLTEKVDLSFDIHNANIETNGVRRSDGRLGNFEDDKQKGAIDLRYWADNSDIYRASLYANNDRIGFGVGYAFLSALGETELHADWKKPTWDFFEGALDDAVRDRLGFTQSARINDNWSISTHAAYNNYSVKTADDVMKTATFGGQIVRNLVTEPYYLALGYGLDAEYRLDEDLGRDATGEQYTLMQIDSREIHNLSVIAGKDLTEDTRVDGSAGYAVNRLGQHGPFVEGRLTHDMYDNRLQAQFRAGYGLLGGSGNAVGDTDLVRAGGYLMYRF